MANPVRAALRSLPHGSLFKCRMCWRIGLSVFAAILVVEAVILVFSAQRFEAERLAEIEQGGIAWIKTIFEVHANKMAASDVVMASREVPELSQISGLALYDPDGTLIGAFGSRPGLVPGKGSPARSRSADGAHLDMIWDAARLEAPFIVTVRLDTASVAGELRGFIWRVGWLVLIVSSAGTLAAMLVLGVYVFTPIILLRARLMAAGENPTEVDAHVIETAPRDELGDVTEAFNAMVRRVAAGISKIRANEHVLAEAKTMLERRVAERTTELSEANRSLRREATEREAAERQVKSLSHLPDSNPDPVLRLSKDGTVVFANPPSRDLLGAWKIDVGAPPPDPYRQIAVDVARSGQPVDVEATATEKIYALSFQPSEDGDVHVYGRDMTSFRQARERLNRTANFDRLTGLPNRNLLYDRLHQTVGQAKRDGARVAVHLINIDNFSEINKTLGLAAGDRILQEAAERLQVGIREPHTVARLGADEFAIIQMSPRDADSAASLAQRITESLGETYHLDGEPIRTSVSAGITLFPDDAEAASDLLRNADLAMDRAKAEGGAGFCFFEAEMNEEIQRRKALEKDMRDALEKGEFRLHFQPKIRLADDCVCGAEVLIRWEHPEQGFLSPAEFIPIAERSRQIVAIGEWVLGEACRQSMEWARAGFEPVKLAVNLSAVQFTEKGLAGMVGRKLLESGIDTKLLELEITESVVMEEVEATIEILEELSALGVSLSIDDFGTGYSSLSYLKRFPIDRIKIDKSFIDGIGEEADADAIVNAVISLGHTLGLEVTAEGVETEDQLRHLKGQGCEEIQGYFFSRPLPEAEFRQFVEARRQG